MPTPRLLNQPPPLLVQLFRPFLSLDVDVSDTEPKQTSNVPHIVIVTLSESETTAIRQ